MALLLLVTLVWGTTFPVIRSVAAHLSGMEISALRFLVAGLCMLPVALKASRAAWLDGVLLGVVGFIAYLTQAIGLEYISSNRSAFLTSLNVLCVPILSFFLGKLLSLQVIGAAALACAGIALMSWEGGGNWTGDGATFACALAYAAYIILLSERARMHRSQILAATQIVTMALIGVASVAVADIHSGTLSTLRERAVPELIPIVYLGVVATAGTLFLQALGQRDVSAGKAAVIYALEPVFAALFAWLWLHETMSGRALAGGALVVMAVIIGEWRFSCRPTRRRRDSPLGFMG